jgi:hypothetical protein
LINNLISCYHARQLRLERERLEREQSVKELSEWINRPRGIVEEALRQQQEKILKDVDDNNNESNESKNNDITYFS